MVENKTRQRDDSVDAFIASIDDDAKRADSEVLVELMHRVTGEEPARGDPASSASGTSG